MNLKIYISYKEFEQDFHNNFKKWQIYNYEGELIDYIKEYLEEYNDFYDICEETNEIRTVFRTWHKDSLKDEEVFIKSYLHWINLEDEEKKSIDITKIFNYDKILELFDKKKGKYYRNKKKYKNFQLAVPKIINFLLNKKKELQEQNKYETTKQLNKPKFKTNITATQLAELTKALMLNKNIEIDNQEDFFNWFADTLNVTRGKTPFYKIVNSLKGRTEKKELLLKLRTELKEYQQKCDEKIYLNR